MNKDDKNITFRKSINQDSINNQDSQRQRIKKKLMDKYNINDKEAEAVLVRLEKMEENKRNEEIQKPPLEVEDKKIETKKQNAPKLNKPINDDVDVIVPQHVLDREKQKEEQKSKVSDSRKIRKSGPEISNGKPNNDVVSDGDVPKKSVPKKVVSDGDVPKKSVPKKVVSDGDVPKKSVPKKVVSDGDVPKKAVPKKVVSEDVVSEDEVAKDVSSKDIVSDDPVPPKRGLKKKLGNLLHSKDDAPKSKEVLQNIDDDNVNSLDESKDSENDVDSIVSGIVPGYSSDVSIEVSHVDLSFDVATDNIDTLKESFIRTIKRNKSKKFKFKALNDISFKIYQGEKIGIIGYNGAGKSTLLRVITGIYTPDNGEVVTRGNISPLLSLGAGFDRNYSGRKNIYLNGAVLGYSKKFLQEKEAEIIEFSELGEFIDLPIRNYSSGMIAKLGFSIATMVNPDILIIDEILSVGDVNFKRKSSDKIRSLMDGKTTVVLVSHSIPQIRSLCSRAIWIDKGEIREIGDANEVCNHYLKDSEKASKEQLRNIQFR
ncbi:ATP-binding cassette domain-containing protein [Methanobrevibacter sp. YE315]|uniref:ATP-binding cassette domain-containing protein n=1 Tax=Methanobrevibacter sp. YE315 TaxID=1609968 RepID=UPI000A6AB8BF|nr:ATP-binding cassette domain-containing protein [Methanobrevibacter sp. YE315]